MHPDIDELRPKLKEILYDCHIDIKATKAALYLLDPAIRKFELVTEYGFRSAIPQSANYNHPLIDRCARGRTPFFVNSLNADPKLSQVLFDASSERLLVAPLFSRGELVGLIDMRDKAGKQPFDQPDVGRAQTIAEKMLSVFAAKNIFNQRFITLADVDLGGARPAAQPENLPTTPIPIPEIAAPAPSKQKPRVMKTQTGPIPPAVLPLQGQPTRLFPVDLIVEQAKNKAAKIIVPPEPRTFGEGELRAVRDVLRGMLYLPGSLAAAFTMTGSVQEIAAKNTLSDEARDALQAKLEAWLIKRGESAGPVRPTVQTPFGEAGAPITAAQLQKVYTAAVNVSGYRGLYLTVAFAEAPGRSTHELLAALLSQLQLAIEVSNSRDLLEHTRARAAGRLLEPDFMSYPELRRHSDAVTARAAAFAQYLDLSPAEVETVTLTALVHDVGMRVIDYDRLYMKKDPSAQDLALLKEHVVISAAMAEPVLGHEIARAILCHHERVDGAGYPNGLKGDEIPLASRIVQICDVYVTVTDPAGYHRTESHGDALALLKRGAGAQFDKALVEKFLEMMQQPA
ncbi:MAG TPA: HD domain-containing phosphohydrolase [Thermoanaerobaculia bacterium]